MSAFDILHTTPDTTKAAERFCVHHDISFESTHPTGDGAHASILYAITEASPEDAKQLRKTWRAAYARACATPADRVTRSRAKALRSGARRIEVILRDPAAIAGLDRLTDEHGGVTAAVTAALKR